MPQLPLRMRGHRRIICLTLCVATVTRVLRKQIAELTGVQRRPLCGGREKVMLIRIHCSLQMISSSLEEGGYAKRAHLRAAKRQLQVKFRRLPECDYARGRR